MSRAFFGRQAVHFFYFSAAGNPAMIIHHPVFPTRKSGFPRCLNT